MFETYRMLGHERELELVHEAERLERGAPNRTRRGRKRIAWVASLAVVALVSTVPLVTTARAASPHARSSTTPAWARPLSGLTPHVVERNYGVSRGLTCDLAIYTTNRAALDGTARLRPGDVTATVCVVRRVDR